MKEKSKAIANLNKENNRLVAKKRVMDGELAELRPLRQHVNELGWLRKELEERDSKFSRLHKESKKKDSELELAQKKLKESNSALQSIQHAYDEEKKARKMADDLLSNLEKERAIFRAQSGST